MRSRVVAVRLTLSELRAVRAERARTPIRTHRRDRVSLGMWCRWVLNECVSAGRLRPSMPTPTDAAVAHVVEACADLNQYVRASHTAGGVVAGSLLALSAVCDAADSALPDRPDATESAAVPPGHVAERRTSLINVRGDESEVAQWSTAAETAGFKRVSAWARDVLIGVAGIGPSHRLAALGVLTVRAQLAGALTNAAQLHSVALDYDEDVAETVDQIAVRLRECLAAWSTLGAAK